MIGAIIGDIVGSAYEFCNIRTKEFPLISPLSYATDDTVMSLAVADILQREVAHNHEEGLKAAEVVAMSVFMAKTYVFNEIFQGETK